MERATAVELEDWLDYFDPNLVLLTGESAARRAASEFEKPTLSIEGTSVENEKLDVIGALAELVKREGIDEDTLVVAGDNVISFDLSDFIDTFERNEAPTLAAYDVESRERAKSYGLVELKDNRVVGFQEKPDDPESTLVSIACYAFPGETLDRLAEYLADGNNSDEPGWFVQWLQARQVVYTYTFDETWFDIGTAEGYLEALEWQFNGDNYVAEGAVLENSEFGANAHLLSGAELHDTSIDNAVVFDDVRIENSEISRLLIDREARIESANLDGALMGEHAEVLGE